MGGSGREGKIGELVVVVVVGSVPETKRVDVKGKGKGKNSPGSRRWHQQVSSDSTEGRGYPIRGGRGESKSGRKWEERERSEGESKRETDKIRACALDGDAGRE